MVTHTMSDALVRAIHEEKKFYGLDDAESRNEYPTMDADDFAFRYPLLHERMVILKIEYNWDLLHRIDENPLQKERSKGYNPLMIDLMRWGKTAIFGGKRSLYALNTRVGVVHRRDRAILDSDGTMTSWDAPAKMHLPQELRLIMAYYQFL